ncbi:hypothetical protein [Mesonia sp. K7]|uniref:hypothetical protein n=1 Tax=Mesonia sp. K7 TaxID=2218606 RepID=UPI000DA908BC|nr:hypothetical protein [Mesonia sp. K7]PZD79019.1 hypothetical protein DNG35_03155 [Mesonia sp. K7]
MVGCEPDIEIEKEDAIIEHSYKIITSEEIPDFDKIKTNLGNLENTSSIFLGRTVETYYGIENVITDEVIQITDEYGVSNYILEIDTHFEETGYLENMILMETTDGYISYIMRYTPSDEYMADELNYTPEGNFVIDPENFEGTITKYSLEREEIWRYEPETQAINSITITICSFSLVQYCSNTYSGNPNGEPHVRGPKCNGPFSQNFVESCYTVSIGGGSGEDGGEPSDGEPGDGSGNNNPGNGDPGSNDPPSNGGGNGNYNGQTDGTLIIDGQPLSGIGTSAVSNELTAIKQFSENIDIRISVLIALLDMNINHPLYNYINFEMEGETMQQVINFLTDNKDENGDVLPEAQAFALEAMQFISENPGITFSEYENWFSREDESQDFFYDADYWENPNLTFP